MRDPWEPLTPRDRYRFQVHRLPTELELARQERAYRLGIVRDAILASVIIIVTVGAILAGWGQS
jgi:hypothetical protein